MYEGKTIRLGGTDHVVPPLTLAGLKRVYPKLVTMTALGRDQMPSPEQVDVMAEVIAEALKRNYPDYTLEKVLEIVDLASLVPTFEAIVALSGLQAKAVGSGEAPSP